MRQTIFFVIFFSLTLAAFASAIVSTSDSSDATSADGWESNPLLKTTSPETLRKLRALKQIVNDNGCDINLCFALQGDEFISDEEFQDQKNFVDLMIAIITTDSPGNYAAVQYGRTTRAIQSLTGEKEQFLIKLHETNRVGGLNTNIASALGYCGFQLRPRTEDANKIVLLGDGLDSVGFRPKWVASRVRDDGTDISAVAVGGVSFNGLIDIVGGDPNKVVTIDGFFELAEIIFGLITNVCGLHTY